MSDTGMTRTGRTSRNPQRGFADQSDWDQVWRLLGNIQSTDDSLLSIQVSNRGIYFTPKSPRARAKAIAEESATEFSTPFEGSIHADGNKVTIGVTRDAGSGGGPAAFGDEYLFFDTITIGLDRLTKFEPEDTTAIADTSFIYYKITKAGAIITADLEHDTNYPDQAHGEVFIILGRAFWDGTKISNYEQYWFGDIHIPARFA